MSVVYAVPASLPPVPVDAWGRSTVSWRGWDSSVWPLSDPYSGVFLTNGGVEGLGMPAHQAWTSSSPAVHGQSFRGMVVEPRPVFWPVFVYSDASSDEWLERDRAFWKSLRPGMHGEWSVTTPGGTRTLACRFVDDGNHSYTVDPFARGWVLYGVSLVADDPFWKGSPVSRSWAADPAPQNFYDPDGTPLLHLSPGFSMSSAKMTNEGDVEAWPVWTITGPITTVDVGVDGRTVSWDVALVEGDVLVIDTDPTVQSAWLNGVDVTDQLGSADFAPIPAGEDRTLSLTMTGDGLVEATITPRHFRAW